MNAFRLPVMDKNYKNENESYTDIREKLCYKAKEQYAPQDVSPFIHAHHMVCAIESENGEIYTRYIPD